MDRWPKAAQGPVACRGTLHLPVSVSLGHLVPLRHGPHETRTLVSVSRGFPLPLGRLLDVESPLSAAACRVPCTGTYSAMPVYLSSSLGLEAPQRQDPRAPPSHVAEAGQLSKPGGIRRVTRVGTACGEGAHSQEELERPVGSAAQLAAPGRKEGGAEC